MSFGKLEKFYLDVQKSRKEVSPELYPSNSFYIIPFSKMFEQKESHYIYIGNEKIPFKEKHPEFRAILRHEFSKSIKMYAKNVK
jgi:hypothetical protein